MTHEIHYGGEQRIKRGALVMGAVLVGGLFEAGRAVYDRRQETIADVKSYCEDDGPSFIFIGGCGENNLAQAPIFHDKLKGYGSMHFEYEIQGEHDQDNVDQSIIKACKIDGDRDRVIVATSFGLMKSMRSLLNPAVREAIGENRLKAVVSRSGITSRVDLQQNMQQAASGSANMPPLPIVSDLWRAYRLHRAHRDIPHSPNTTDQEVLIHHESSAYVPYRLVKSQHRAINDSRPWEPGSHQIVVDENPDLQLFQISALHDGVANWKSTSASMESAFGRKVEEDIDERRPLGSHADDLEFIEPLARRMALLSNRNSHMLAAAVNLETYRRGLALVS